MNGNLKLKIMNGSDCKTNMNDNITPRVYVGTYAKYNSGNLDGKWFDPSLFDSKEDFLEAVQNYHGPGEHEFMFQDWEGIPARFISESYINEDLWGYLDQDEETQKILLGWLQYELNGTLEAAQDKFIGVYDSPNDYAYEYIESMMDKKQFEIVQNYLDLDAIVRDLECGSIYFALIDGQTYVYDTAL
jgi:antirestriction protein